MDVPKLVLIVDDDPLVHAMAEAYFEGIGTAKTISAENGAEGLKLLDTHRDAVDLILCDLNMPDVDGLQFLRFLMERRFQKPIVIVSGEDSDIVRSAYNLAASHNLNVIGKVEKPIRGDVLDGILATPVAEMTPVKATFGKQFGEADLRSALRLGEIVPFFQPKICTRTGAIIGAEALARWSHPQEGQIPPDAFIPVAEKYDLVKELTTCMLRQALAEVRRWEAAGHSIHVAINTDAQTVNQLGFPDEILSVVKSAGVAPSLLTLEVTERSLLAEGATSIEVLTRLRMMEFGISIDDFGTGNSNIKQLCTYPFSELKIDKSFLSGVETDQTKAVCLNAIVSLAKALKLKTVAEGIETESDRDLARRAGIDELQGYLFARPMKADEFLDFLNMHRDDADATPADLRLTG